MRRAQYVIVIMVTVSFLVAPPLPAAAPDSLRHTYTQLHMGGQVRITVWATDEQAVPAVRAAFARFAALEQVASDYRPSSEVRQLCAQTPDQPVAVSADLLRLLTASNALAARSGGAFDITVGPAVALWRQARRDRRLPDPAALAAARGRIDWHLLQLDPAAATARLLRPGMLLDLGGIAKGDAADQALLELRRHGVGAALIEAGGDIVAGDPPPGSAGWQIEVPSLPPAERRVVLANAAISTSGDTNQFLELDGRRYSHIVDPRTGLGCTDRTMATVIAPRGIDSDSLATACCVLGQTAGQALLAATPGVRGFVYPAPDEPLSGGPQAVE
ncbi:MAG: FAD:protein FMN transferase [Fimbriimonadaceae bacterium]|nr:FAD:protein FMN transferase [Fimbriimonadaceae bacterium]